VAGRRMTDKAERKWLVEGWLGLYRKEVAGRRITDKAERKWLGEG